MSDDGLIWDVAGWDENPAGPLETWYRDQAQPRMKDLPFYRAGIPVAACDVRLFEGQWVGVLVTPWMVDLVVLPGPGQCWPRRQVGDAVGLAFPAGDLRFRVGEPCRELHLMSCSLLSPLPEGTTAEEILALAHNSLKMLMALPVRQDTAPGAVDTGRRALLHIPR